MEVDPVTIWRWHRQRGFLMWRRRKGTRTLWFTNDMLIHAWERERCNADLSAIQEKAKRKTKA